MDKVSLERYHAAKHDYDKRTHPVYYRDHGWIKPKALDTTKANDLTTFIINFLTWSGWRATRINVSGRLIEKAEKQPSGVSLMTKKWIKSSTRKGTADISATVNGRSLMLEIKVGRDRPSEHQLKEQQRERAAGGVYEFIHSPEEFFELYDRILYG